MLLYVNGDETCGGACSVNNYVQSNNDIQHTASGTKAHPENVMHSFGYYFSKLLNVGFRCEATVKKFNSETFAETEKFVVQHLPKLQSAYTVVCIGLIPGVVIDELNHLAALLKQKNIEYIFFNISKPIPASSDIKFSNLIDLHDLQECFIPWSINNGHILKNNQYPNEQAHNAWAKYIFSKMIEVY